MITRKNLDINQIISNAKTDFLNTLILGSPFPPNNILHQYRTFNYRVTLAIVSGAERKSQSYKTNGFDYIVFQSHGKNVDGITPTGNTDLDKLQSFVNMVAYGSRNRYDFYLEDLYIKSFMASNGRDWATQVKLKIVEPYSMDTFLTSIMTGLSAKGYYTLDRNATFILKIDFVGFKEKSEEPEIIPYTTRYYTLSMVSLTANLTSEGTHYELLAIPTNELARLDDINILSEPVKLKGKTVGEMISSLETALNDIGKAKLDDSNIIPDKFKIIFVNDKDEEVEADQNSNIVTAEIKGTKMFDSVQDSGVREFLKDKSLYKVARSIEPGQQNAEETSITLTVDGRMGILSIIDSIIVDSYFLVDKVKKKFDGYYDADGQVKWWRIVPEVENGQWIPNLGKFQKIVTYYIVPRKVHYTKLTSIFVPSHVAPAKDYESMIARVYEWNYTGNNKDILSFNINYNQLWTKLITPNYGKKPETQGASNPTKNDNGDVIKAPNSTENLEALKRNAVIQGSTTTFYQGSGSAKENQVRSGSETNPVFDLQRDISKIINNPYEQIILNLEILGDPMWLGTQYIDGRSNVSNQSGLFTADGGIAIRTVDPILRVLCYAPHDVNKDGFIATNEGESRRLSSYSAHYTVIEIESFFQNGVFKQRLKGNRNSQQDMSLLSQLDSLNKGDRFTEQKIDLSIR